MKEQHSLLATLEMTPHASKMLAQFKADVQQQAKNFKLSSHTFQQFFEDQVYFSLQTIIDKQDNGSNKVDAEIMISALEELGTPADLLARYQAGSQHAHAGSPLYRRLHRSSNEKLLAGVCGGIAEYFQIDPVLVRAAFVACCFLAGMTIFLYPILWFILPKRSSYTPTAAPTPAAKRQKNQVQEAMPPATAQTPPSQAKQPQVNAIPTRKGFWGRLLGTLAFVFLSICFYLPATLLLLGGVSYCIWGIFYPIVHIDGFQFSFAALGAPGTVMAIFAGILLFSLFLLVITFMARLHFKSKVLGRNSLVIAILMVVVCLFGVASSIAIVGFQNRAHSVTSLHKKFALADTDTVKIDAESLRALNSSNLRLRNLTVRTIENSKAITVHCTLRSRGQDDEQVRHHLQQIEVSWPDSALFPKIDNQNRAFHFEEATLEIVVPDDKNLDISGISRPQLVIVGKYAKHITLQMQSTNTRLHNVATEKLKFNGDFCHLSVEQGTIKTMEINSHHGHFRGEDIKSSQVRVDNQLGHMRLHKLYCDKITAINHKGHMQLDHSTGALALQNSRGKFSLKQHQFLPQSNSIIENYSGKVRIALEIEHLPQIEINNNSGKVKNRLPQFAESDAVLKLNTNYGFVDLHEFKMRKGRAMN